MSKGVAMKHALLMILTFVALQGGVARAATQESFGFVAQPDQCIALHQGQVCYQELTFTWTTPTGGEYCLYQLDQQDALICWNGNEQNSFHMDFASSTSLTYQIRTRGQTEVLSQVTVEVAWVYRATRKSFTRWRLF